MPQILVNADDYGIDRNRTEAIRECFRRGILSSTTLMVNMSYCDEAVRLARADGFADKVGLHLNLTRGVPLTKNFKLGSLNRFFLTKGMRDAVREEVSAQMEKYKAYGLPMMHLDSHHHIHTYPSVLRIVLPLAKKYGFKTIRISRNMPNNLGIFARIYKSFVNGMIVKSGVRPYTDGFGSYKDVKTAVGDGVPGNIKTIEIMTHPLYYLGADMHFGKFYESINGVLSDSGQSIDQLEGWVKAL